jgi:hypothetical protein
MGVLTMMFLPSTLTMVPKTPDGRVALWLHTIPATPSTNTAVNNNLKAFISTFPFQWWPDTMPDRATNCYWLL